MTICKKKYTFYDIGKLKKNGYFIKNSLNAAFQSLCLILLPLYGIYAIIISRCELL